MVTLPEGKPLMPKHWKHPCFPQNLSVFPVHQFPSLVIPLQPTLWILIEYIYIIIIIIIIIILIIIIYIYIHMVLNPLGFRGTHIFGRIFANFVN